MMPRDVPKVTFILPKTPHRLLLFSFWTLEEVLEPRTWLLRQRGI